VTNHVLSIVAIVSSLEVHITSCIVAVEGVIVATNCNVSQALTLAEDLFNVTHSTGIIATTEQVSVYHQSVVVTVIVQFHASTYVTNQSLSTVATLVSLELHVTSG